MILLSINHELEFFLEHIENKTSKILQLKLHKIKCDK